MDTTRTPRSNDDVNTSSEPPSPYKRVRWRCRRGMKELDVMLTRFLDHQFDVLSDANKDHFVELLEQTDMDLFDWCTGRTQPTNERFAELIAQIRLCSKLS